MFNDAVEHMAFPLSRGAAKAAHGASRESGKRKKPQRGKIVLTHTL